MLCWFKALSDIDFGTDKVKGIMLILFDKVLFETMQK